MHHVPNPPVRRGLWWGTVEGASLVDLIDAAGAAGYTTISVSPALYAGARDAGLDDDALRARLAAAGVEASILDPLIRGLPGAREPQSVPRRFRSTFEFGEDDAYRVAEAVGARAINVAHYLGEPTPLDELADAVGAIADRAMVRGLDILVEFMPDGGIPDLAAAAAVVARVDRANVGLMFDTWHFFRTGADAEQLDALAPRTIRAVQVSDALADVHGSWTTPPRIDRLQAGEGDIPLLDLLRRVFANNPDVAVGPEVFDTSRLHDSALDRARNAAVALDRLLASVVRTGE
jgi:sugar phosphate isomerase/epimerase